MGRWRERAHGVAADLEARRGEAGDLEAGTAWTQARGDSGVAGRHTAWRCGLRRAENKSPRAERSICLFLNSHEHVGSDIKKRTEGVIF